MTDMQAMILTRDEKNRRKTLLKLLPMQRADFAGLFKAMDGFPVVIRTLDPPLHEFLPKREVLMVDLAKLPAADLMAKKEMAARYAKLGATVKDLKKVLTGLLERVEELHEFNPMLGHRGCRLGITYPEITEMQARAIFEAAVQVAKKGVKVIPEVMIPLIGSVEKFDNQKKIVVKVAEEVLAKANMKDLKYPVGHPRYDPCISGICRTSASADCARLRRSPQHQGVSRLTDGEPSLAKRQASHPSA
ncbi:MAG: putative PEP-binding protein [Bryobacteraceae bacterium]